MVIYGTAIAGACLLLGNILGSALGTLLHIDSNVGGLAIAMILMMLVSNRYLLHRPVSDTMSGVLFWKKMYVPIVIALASIQDLIHSLAGSLVVLLSGIAIVAVSLITVRLLSREKKEDPLP